MKKLRGMSGLATVVLTTGLATTTYAEDKVELPVEKTSKTEASDVKTITKADVTASEKALAASEERLKQQTLLAEEAKVSEQEAKKQVEALAAEVAELEEANAQLTPAVMSDLETALTVAEQDVVEGEKVVAEAQANLDAMTTTLSQQEDSVATAHRDLEQAEKAELEASKAVTDAEWLLTETSKTSLENRLKQEKSALEQAKADVVKSEESLKEATLADERLKQTVTALEEEVTKAQSDLTDKQNLLNQATTDVTATQEEIAALQKDIEQLKVTIAQLEKTLNIDKTAAIRDLERALDAVSLAQNELRLAEQALALAEQTEKQRQQAISQARSQLRQEQDKYSRAVADLERLARDYHAAKPNTDVTSLPYYTQTAPALINHVIGRATFGATGCGPTVLAMIFSELLGRTIAPLEVGYWLYNNTNEFNKRFEGTSSVGLIQASHAYGLDTAVLSSPSAITKSLQDGNLVVAAVQHNKFSPWGPQYSHFIVLKGYSNGHTYVYDPYTKVNAGWYPVANLWREQSKDPIDTTGVGAPFIQISSRRLARLQSDKQALEARVRQQESSRQNAYYRLTRLEQQGNASQTATYRVASATQHLQRAENHVRKERAKVAQLDSLQQRSRADIGVYRQQLVSKQTALEGATQRLTSAKQVQADSHASYRQASQQLRDLTVRMTDLSHRKPQLALAKASLEKASQRLDAAEKSYQETQEALNSLSASREKRLAVLEQANNQLAEKRALKNIAKEHLSAELANYMRIKEAYDTSILTLTNAQKEQDIKIANLASRGSRLEKAKALPQRLELTRASLSEAKATLSHKKDALLGALATLRDLQIERDDKAQQHDMVIKAYAAYLGSQRQVALLSSFEAIQDDFEQPKVNLEIADKPEISYNPKSETLATAPLAMPRIATGLTSLSRSDRHLPKTGESSSLMSLAFAGISLMLSFGLSKHKTTK